MPDYAAHEAVYFSQAITADDFAMKKNPKYVNKVVAPTLEPISSIGGFRTLPDYSFDTMPDDYVALVLIGGFGWNTPVAEKVMPIIKSAIEQEKVIGAICNAASFMAKCGSYYNRRFIPSSIRPDSHQLYLHRREWRCLRSK